MSTILDALRKLQRERAAESPSRDLRGSITHETPKPEPEKRGGRNGWIAALLLLVALAGGGFWLQRSGRISAWLESRAGVDTSAGENEGGATEAELADAEREAALAPAEPESAPLGEGSAVALPVAPVMPPTPPRADSPEIAAERARLEAALANARAAQEEQAATDLEAARQATQAAAVAQAPPIPAPAATPPATQVAPSAAAPVAKSAAKPAAVAPAASVIAKKPAAAKPVVAAKPVTRAASAPAPRVESSSFPDVRVESIRWHPVPERRVASLHFEQQDAPEAREGDIVAGVLVYRIDPGAVELHVGSAQRVVSPEP